MHASSDKLQPAVTISKVRRPKAQRGRTKTAKKNGSPAESCRVSQKSSHSPLKSVHELQVLEVPPEYDTESDRVIEYMLGDKAKEIESPLFQTNIQSKLVYSLT